MDDFMKKVVNLLNIMEYVAFGLATILVVVFQFTGLSLFVTIGLVVYTVAFIILFTSGVIQCKELFDKSRGVVVTKKAEQEIEEGKEVVNINTEKTWAIIKTVASGLFAIFTFVVLILF